MTQKEVFRISVFKGYLKDKKLILDKNQPKEVVVMDLDDFNKMARYIQGGLISAFEIEELPLQTQVTDGCAGHIDLKKLKDIEKQE